MRVAEPQGDVREEVDRDTTQEREGVLTVEGVVDVHQRVLDAKGGEDDPGDHGEVQVRVGVARERVALPTLHRLREPAFRDQRDDVEVDPPECRREADTEHGRGDDLGRQLDLRTDAEGDDRLAERQDDHQVVPLGEVTRHQAPSLGPEQCRPAPVEDDRRDPQPRLREAVEERRAHQQADADGCAGREGPHRVAKRGIVAAGEHEQRDVAGAHDSVRDRERQRAVAERLGHAERDDEHRCHRTEHGAAHGALFGVDDAGEPGVAHPGPPEDREHEHPASDALPRRLRGHQRAALREAEHEDEIEEQLQRLDGLALPERGAEPRHPSRRGRRPAHPSTDPRYASRRSTSSSGCANAGR